MVKKKISIISLGCFRNTYDSEVVLKRFSDKGYAVQEGYIGAAPSTRICDTLLINTCGFIEKAKEESIECIRQAVKLKNEGRIRKLCVFGCLVKRYPDELKEAFPQVDDWWGVEEFSSQPQRRKRIFAGHLDFLKICEGCFNQCSYCTIPLIKGTLKSKPPSQIVKEACLADKHGVKELNIIGQDISSWGRDLGADFTLPTLLKDILVKTKIAWLRLLYLHPRHISEELLDLIANEDRICKYIDLPIQHVNDRILKLMNRGITKKEIAQIIAKIREKINNCAIRTSVIAGFPTETKEEFKELLQFLKEVKFEKLGAFVYSREEDTPAYKLKPQVLAKTKEQRYRQIMNLQKNISKELNKKFIGQTLEVLVEEEDNGVFLGRSQYDAYEVDGLVFIKKNGLRIGDFYKTKIINSYDYDLVGV